MQLLFQPTLSHILLKYLQQMNDFTSYRLAQQLTHNSIHIIYIWCALVYSGHALLFLTFIYSTLPYISGIHNTTKSVCKVNMGDLDSEVTERMSPLLKAQVPSAGPNRPTLPPCGWKDVKWVVLNWKVWFKIGTYVQTFWGPPCQKWAVNQVQPADTKVCVFSNEIYWAPDVPGYEDLCPRFGKVKHAPSHNHRGVHFYLNHRCLEVAS